MAFRMTYRIQKGIYKEKCDDSALLGTYIVNNEAGEMIAEGPLKICVGDGVGGNAGSDEASLFVMDRVANIPEQISCEDLIDSLREINRALIAHAGKIQGHETMATTLTGLFLTKKQALLAHCGNTRLYAAQGSFLKQITEDQTISQWLINTGNAAAAEVCNKNEIRGAFGGGNEKFIEPLEVSPVFERGLPAKILMTSDGVHEYLSADEMEDILRGNSSRDAAEIMIQKAVAAGSEDDCTVIIVDTISDSIIQND